MGYIEGALVEIIQDSTVVKSGYTDANGKYSTVLGAGTYKIRISKTGYQTIEKTETLAYPSELMVNLPYMVPVETRSGAAFLFVTGEVGNPEITTMLATFIAPIALVPSTLSLYSLDASPSSMAAVTSTVYSVSVA